MTTPRRARRVNSILLAVAGALALADLITLYLLVN